MQEASEAKPAELDPLRMAVGAEENLMSYRQSLMQQTWEAALKASETRDQGDLDALIRLHAAIKAIDHALAHKPSVYKMLAPI